MLESLPSGVLTTAPSGKITFVNRAGSEILGEDRAHLLGAQASAYIPELPTAASPGRFEIQLDEDRVLGGNVASLGEESRGQVVVFQDLTELRRLQGDLARAERLQTLGRFAAGMAHELRNPLAAMIGCLQLLKADAKKGTPLSEEAMRMLGIVDRESTRLEGLVSDFLTYARPSPPNVTVLDVGELCRRCAQAAGAGEDASIEVTAEAGPHHARGDADQLQQVMWNLLGNALQATRGEMGPTRGEPPRIEVRVRRHGAACEVQVDDNGPGIADVDRGRIFEPFFTRRASGTGLGLATSHQLIMSQQGDIDVGSSPLGGARFTLRLPAAEAPADRTGRASTEPARSARAEEAEAGGIEVGRG